MNEPAAVIVPQMNPNDETAVLNCWLVEPGTWVENDQALATLETTKSTFDVNAPRAGYVFYDAEPKSVVAVLSSIAWISDENTPPTIAPPPEKPAAGNGASSGSRITRKALLLMKEHGIDAEAFAALEKVTTEDVERFIKEGKSGSAARAPGAPQGVHKGAPKTGPTAPPGTVSLEQPASKIIEIQMLGETYRDAIPSTISIELPCAAVDAQLRNLAAQHGPISLLEFAIRESAKLLGDFPELNGCYFEGKAWTYPSVAVGFALNLSGSLRVPVVHRTTELSQLEIARTVRDLSLKCARGELSVPELTGGTFTITDLSANDVTHFIPVLNYRQSAILGICAPRAGTDTRDLVLTFDHRMSDGMQASQFLAELRVRLQGA